MNDLVLLAHQAAFEVRSFRRNIAATIFAFVFPIMLLVVFGSLNSGARIDSLGGLPYIQFFMPGILAFGLISNCYTGLGMRIALLRENGVLKRLRGTPLPLWAYVGGQIGCAVAVTLLVGAVTLAIGVLAFGAELPLRSVPGLLLATIVGAAAFSSLGLAITTVIPNADAATGIIQFSLWPVLFVSDIFYASPSTSWASTVGAVFPIKHLANAMQHPLNPATTGFGIRASDLAALAAWGLLGAVVTARRFRWEERRAR